MRLESFLQVRELSAAGTSEGAQKGWDTRGRGKKPQQTTTKPVTTQPTKAPTKAIADKMAKIYHDVEEDKNTIQKIHEAAGIKQIVGKHLWFAKRVGDYAQSGYGTAQLVKDAVGMLSAIVLAAQTTAAHAVHAIGWVHQHLGPLFHHITSTLHFSGEGCMAEPIKENDQVISRKRLATGNLIRYGSVVRMLADGKALVHFPNDNTQATLPVAQLEKTSNRHTGRVRVQVNPLMR